MTQSKLWWTGPGDDDCVEIHAHPNEITIWQYRSGDITSVTVDTKTALEIAAFITANIDRRN